MAHQCLQCGQSFPDGSAELLKGCPQCQGTRFYYTQSPLAKQEREALRQQANRDIKEILQELVKGHGGPARPSYEDPVWSTEAREKWLQVDARKLRAHEQDAVREVAPPELPPTQARIDAPPPPPRPAKAAPPKPKAEQAHLPVEPDRPAPTQTTPSLDDSEPREVKPEVVTVQEPGRYDIDVRQLMENSPVVVRRDGVYVVHLPSVFAAAGKR